MKSYKYFVFMYAAVQEGPRYETSSIRDLERLLTQGWKPVRETPMGGGPLTSGNLDGFAYAFASLILLEKDEPSSSIA